MTLAHPYLELRRSRVTRWLSAAVFVVTAHVGCAALAMLHWEEDSDDFGGGPIVIEMVPAAAAMPVDTPDVARGPLIQEQTETPPPSEETKEVVEQEIPPVDPSPLAPEPEVALPMPHPDAEKKPEEEEPKEEVPQQRSADQAAPIPLTTAPQRVEAKDIPPVPAAPSPQASPDVARSKATWEKALVSHLNRFKRYPDRARIRRHQGNVRVSFTIDRTGRVTASRVVGSSGSPALDDEALAVLQRASPLPAPPAQVPGESFNWTMPIQFRIR
jgi:protein TonB